MVCGDDFAAQGALRRDESRPIRAIAASCQLSLETRRHARKFRTVLAPVFPRYLFVILDVGPAALAQRQRDARRPALVTDGERPIAVAPGVVETLIQSSDRRGALIYETDKLAVGDAVKLVAGPFAGSLGILHRLDGAGRVQVLLELLGGPVKVTTARDTVAATR